MTSSRPDLPPRTNILGVGVSAITMAMALDIIGSWIAHDAREYVTVADVHSVMRTQRDAHLRQIHGRAGLVTPDGMPLVWLSRLYGQRGVERVYGPDLMMALCGHSAAYRHFFYGGKEGTPEKLAARLREKFPDLLVVGTCSPPFRPLTEEEDESVVSMINAAAPDIVWVGLGAPKQERWIADHRDRLDAPVLIGVGAAFDFLAGLKRQAPRWMQRSGLEWFFRLLCEPRRLGRRYLVNNPLFVFYVLLQLSGLRRVQPDERSRP